MLNEAENIQIGDYKVHEKVDQGAYGAVYRVEGPDKK
jgi:hypothetical protein